MGTTPEELKSNIDRTRSELTADVDALADRVSPGAIARRRTEAVRGSVGSVRDKVMGTMSTAGSGVGDAPTAIADRAQGSPLAAGLIAFGAGLLTAALLPSTPAEQKVASQLKDAAAEPVKEFAKDQAHQAQESLQPVAQDAISEVKDTAADAAQATAEHAKTAGSDVAGQARDAAQSVKD
jgi:hypothetical protein